MDDYRNVGKPMLKSRVVRERVQVAFVCLLVLCALGVAGSIDFDSAVKVDAAVKSERVVVVDPVVALREAQLSEFFAREGSPVPVEMARVVAKRKRPRLLAAVAAVESNGNPLARGAAGEVTAWQIIEKEWGSAGTTIEAHSQKAEDILEELIDQHDGNLRRALSAYNGDRSGRYAAKVLRKVAVL